MSAALVEKLVALEGRPWAEMGKTAKPLTQNKLARLLAPLGIGPDNIGTGRLKGYRRSQFEEAFERYLPQTPVEGASQPLNRSRCDETGTSSIFQPLTPEDGRAVGKCEKSNNDGQMSGCAVGKGGDGEEASIWPGLEPHAVGQFARELARFPTNSAAEREAEIRKRLANAGVPPEAHDVEVEKIVRCIDEPAVPSATPTGSFVLIGAEYIHPCAQCGSRDGQIYQIRDGVRMSQPLHEACAPAFFGHKAP